MKKVLFSVALFTALTACGTTVPSGNHGTEPTTQPAASVNSQLEYYSQLPENQVPEIQQVAADIENEQERLEFLQIMSDQDVAVEQPMPTVQQFEQFMLEGEGLGAQDYHGISSYAKFQYIRGVATGSISYFNAEKRSPNYSGLNWSNDGCSVPWALRGVSSHYMNKFNASCLVHDFGYRNVPKFWSNYAGTEGTVAYDYRLAVDQAFLRNMKGQCGDGLTAAPCRGVASVFYGAVRQFGASKLGT